MKCPNCRAEMDIDRSQVYTSIPPQYLYKCPNCGHQKIGVDEIILDSINWGGERKKINPIFEYLSNYLKLDMRQDLNGNNFLCLILEDEIIDKIEFNLESND